MFAKREKLEIIVILSRSTYDSTPCKSSESDAASAGFLEEVPRPPHGARSFINKTCVNVGHVTCELVSGPLIMFHVNNILYQYMNVLKTRI